MTCIIGLKCRESGKVYIGGDSAGSDGENVQVRAERKVFQVGEFLIGFTTSFRMGNLLRYSFVPPKQHLKEMNDFAFIVSQFIPAVQECLDKGGWTKVENCQSQGGTFLLGYRDELYLIENEFSVGKLVDNIAAIGCGDQVALGAMYAMPKVPPKKRIIEALKIAAHLRNSIRPPFVVKEAL